MSGREELDACVVDLGCSSAVHLRTCPHHPANVQRLELPKDAFDEIVAQLEEPAVDLPKLGALVNQMTVEDYETAVELASLEQREFVKRLTNLHLKIPAQRFHKIEKVARQKRENA